MDQKFFDIDCNLTHVDLRAHVPRLLDAAQSVGVTSMLVPGTTLDTSKDAIELGRQYPEYVFPTAGVHPFHADTAPSEDELNQLRELSSQGGIPSCHIWQLTGSGSVCCR